MLLVNGRGLSSVAPGWMPTDWSNWKSDGGSRGAGGKSNGVGCRWWITGGIRACGIPRASSGGGGGAGRDRGSGSVERGGGDGDLTRAFSTSNEARSRFRITFEYSLTQRWLYGWSSALRGESSISKVDIAVWREVGWESAPGGSEANNFDQGMFRSFNVWTLRPLKRNRDVPGTKISWQTDIEYQRWYM